MRRQLHRQLRRTLTEPERILWSRLRNRQLGGYKFRRQHPIGPYITDFACLNPRLVIGLDGRIHSKQKDYDEARTIFLVSQGFEVIRFRNVEIYQQLQVVLDTIRNILALQSENL